MTTQTRFIPRGRSVMTVRITDYRGGCLRGRLSGVDLDGELGFDSTIELLLQMQQLMDSSNAPQRNEEVRSFPVDGGFSLQRKPAAPERTPALAVFQINVMFRQNATWQGNLLWVDVNEEAHFRSVLELLMLLNSALTSGRDAGEQHDE